MLDGEKTDVPELVSSMLRGGTPNMVEGADRDDLRNERKVRLGIIGCGAITESAHIPAALSLPGVELVMISDRDEKRLQHVERQFGLRGIGVVSYQDSFDHVDAIVLALPNSLHRPVGVEFLSRGVHVLCEKPLACTLEECAALCDAALSTDTILAVGYVTRFFPSTTLTRLLLDREFLGPLVEFDYEYGTDGGWSPFSGYNLSRSSSGGGVLVVSGSHFLDRMLYLFDRATLTRYADDSCGGVEANAVAEFQVENKGSPLPGRVLLSKTHKLENRLRIVGQRGVLQVGEGRAESITYLPADSDFHHEIMCSDAHPGAAYFQLQLLDFITAVRHRAKPKVNGAEASASVALIEECYRNAERLRSPWSDATLDRLRASLPRGASEVSEGDLAAGENR